MFRVISVTLSSLVLAIACLLFLKLQEIEDKMQELYNTFGGMAAIGNHMQQTVFHPISRNPAESPAQEEDDNSETSDADSLDGHDVAEARVEENPANDESDDEVPPE